MASGRPPPSCTRHFSLPCGPNTRPLSEVSRAQAAAPSCSKGTGSHPPCPPPSRPASHHAGPEPSSGRGRRLLTTAQQSSPDSTSARRGRMSPPSPGQQRPRRALPSPTGQRPDPRSGRRGAGRHAGAREGPLDPEAWLQVRPAGSSPVKWGPTPSQRGPTTKQGQVGQPLAPDPAQRLLALVSPRVPPALRQR